MKIKYDIPRAHEDYAMVFCLVLMVATGMFHSLQLRLNNVHRSVARSRLSNQTNDIPEIPVCGIPYDELRCSVLQSTDPEILKHCFTDNLLMLSRISVPVFMVMIVLFLQFAFTIDGKHSRLAVRTLWTICAFALVIITYGIHHDSCFHNHTFLLMNLSAGPPFTIVVNFMLEGTERSFPLHRNDNNSNHASIEVDDGPAEPADNRLILWVEIL
ncbi:unnamed protein product [Adineta ricciae]|uniref:Uncharacterized protein n=1 Tax=Adineta ricciae TaxID=249248 RepID=A0A815R4Z0_ADIRI|nr:unnamed protein product [Adineta ricciae]